MQTTRLTRSSVLGKRAHQQQEGSSTAVSEKQLQTPDPTPNPKRVRTASTAVDGDSNKENVPPFVGEVVNIEVSTPRSARSLRRAATEVITPTRARPLPKMHASTSAVSPTTPTGEISHLPINTPPPTPPISLLPLHARARALLRSTCNNANTQIAGRNTERATIQAFLTSFLDVSDTQSDAAESTSLYISGSPGTGKTALVNSVIPDTTTDAKVVFINCMALNGVESLWERLIDEIDDGRKQKSTGRSKKVKGKDVVESLLARHKTKCILILDELDHITPTTQSLSSIFSLPNATPSTLRLIGIANTHTLTSSSSTSSISAASNVQTIHFAPYTPAQLLQILQSRLQPLHEDDLADAEGKAAEAAKKLLPAPTLTLLTKKVAALTGDVRSLFEVLRGAIDLAVTASGRSSPTTHLLPTVDENPLNTPALTVTPTHILAALKAYTPSSTTASATKTPSPAKTSTIAPATTNSEIVVKVNNLGLQARLVLLCILLGSKRLEANLTIATGTSVTSSPKKTPASPMKRSTSLPNPTASNAVGIDPSQLHTYYSTVLTRSDGGLFEAVSRSEFTDLVGVLEGVGLVSLGGTSDISAGTGAKRAFGRSSSFGGGSGFGGAGKGKGDVRLAKGVRIDEVLRGLCTTGTDLDIQQEEVKAIWERESARLARDVKAIEREKERAAAVANGFDGASED